MSKLRELSVWHRGLSNEYSLKPGITRDWIGKQFIEKSAYDEQKLVIDDLVRALKDCHSLVEGINDNIFKELLIGSCAMVAEIADKAIIKAKGGKK